MLTFLLYDYYFDHKSTHFFAKTSQNTPKSSRIWPKNYKKHIFLKKNEKKFPKNLVEQRNVRTFATANKEQHLFTSKCFNSSVG